MSVKFYSNIVSPFVQTKMFFHQEKIEELKKKDIVVPITCEIDLTDGFCNNKCKHCFFGTDKKSTPIYMDTQVIKNTILELSEAGTKAIEFSGGGEPTTHPDICEIIRYTADLGLEVGLITNGLLLTKIKDVINNLKFMRISIDAGSHATYKEVHGGDEFDHLLRSIKDVVQNTDSNKIGIGYLVTPDNVQDIILAAEIFSKIGVRFIQYRPASLEYKVNDEVWRFAAENVKKAIILYGSREFQIFDAGIKWLHLNGERAYTKCHTSSLVAVIKANGDIPLCVLKRNFEDSKVGNIYEGGFFKNWFSEKHQRLIKEIDLHLCRKPCKHDSYNIIFEACEQDLFHKNFV